MNYYSFHVGDYAVHTRHLSLTEDLAYRRLLDLYYTNEGPITLDVERASKLIGMRDHVQDVSEILSNFFVKSEDGYRNKRCDEEIAAYRAKAERAKSANKARWSDKPASDPSLKSDASRIPTNNQEPITKNQSSSLRSEDAPAKRAVVAKPVDVSEEVWSAFKTVRKAKKAPITDLAILGIRREAVKAGIDLEDALTVCCERGWAGFKAEWYTKDASTPKAKPESFYERDLRLKREEAAKWGGASSATDFLTIDAEVSHVPAIESH